MRVKMLISLSVADAGRLGLRASEARHGAVVTVAPRAAGELLSRRWAEAIADEPVPVDDQADEPEAEPEAEEPAPAAPVEPRPVPRHRRRKAKKTSPEPEASEPDA
jgi:hypothetical protein